MRKSFGAILIFILAVSAFVEVSFAIEGELAYLAKGNKAVKVFLKDFANESGQDQVSTAEFKKKFETALLRRKTVKFAVVSSPEASDIQISCAIKKYLYSKTDPVNSFAGAPAMLLDAVTTQNYAELTAEFTVSDTKTGNVIWKSDVKAYVEKMMTPEESVPLVSEKLSRAFLWKSFGKPAK